MFFQKLEQWKCEQRIFRAIRRKKIGQNRWEVVKIWVVNLFYCTSAVTNLRRRPRPFPLVCPCCRADAGRHLGDCPPRRDPLLGWYAGMDVADANAERDRNTTDRRQYQGVGATIRQRRERTLFKRASAGRRRRSAHGATASHQPRQQRRKSLHPISRVNSAGSRKTQGLPDAFSRVNSSSSGCASPQMRPLPKKPSSRASSTAVPPQNPSSRPSSTAVPPLVPLNVNIHQPHHLEQALVDTVVGNEAAAAAASPSALSAMMMNGFHANTSSLLVGLPHIASAGTYNTATCLGTADVLLLPDGQTVVFAPPPGLLPRSASLSPPRPDGSRSERFLYITRGRSVSMVPEDTNQLLYTGGTMARAVSFSPPKSARANTPAHQKSARATRRTTSPVTRPPVRPFRRTSSTSGIEPQRRLCFSFFF